MPNGSSIVLLVSRPFRCRPILERRCKRTVTVVAKRNRIRTALLAALVVGVFPAAVSGQSNGQPARWLDITVGAARPLNGTYLYSAGPAIDANLAFRIGRSRPHPVLMFAAAAQGGFIGNDKCTFDGHGGCLENLPSIRSIAVLFGVDVFGRRESHWSGNLSAGPGVSSVNGEDYGDHVSVLSWHGRMDVARFVTRRTSVVASFRATLVPSTPLNVRGSASGGLGLRIGL